jgi:hypothetical protein
VEKRNTKPTASKHSVLRPLCNLIPTHLVPKLARDSGVDSMARSIMDKEDKKSDSKASS